MLQSISVITLKSCNISQRHAVDVRSRPAPTPNPSLIPKKTKNSKRQSEISKKRQNFITGVARTRMTHEEAIARREYEEEFVLRLKENVW